MHLRIGTRGSRLALAQTWLVVETLKIRLPTLTYEIEVIHTSGDQFRGADISVLGGKGLFVKEIEEALCRGDVDLAIHSLKDLPGEIPSGLALVAFPPREDPRDAFVSRLWNSLQELPAGSTVGTSSPRRKCQILERRRDLGVLPIRGNVDSRLKKLKSEAGSRKSEKGPQQDYDAVILAVAGLKRLGLQPEITEILDPNNFLPAVGQGVLAVEMRKGAKEREEIRKVLNDGPTEIMAKAERAFLQTMGGDCHTALAAYTWLEGDTLHLLGGWQDMQKKKWIVRELSGAWKEAASLGCGLAGKIQNAV